MKKHTLLFIAACSLFVHLLIINDYGFTWDFHFHFFGGGHLLGLSPQELEPRDLPFVEPDPRNAITLPYGAIMSVPPVASYILLHKTWGLLPADAAYHLPIILWGVTGIGILYAFMKEAFSSRVALLSALFIGLMPRYFGDMHNNMKDIPSAVVFTLNVWLLWRLVRHRRLIDLFIAVAAFAIAFNVKINAVFIPVVFGVWVILCKLIKLDSFVKLDKFILYFSLAPLSAFALWSLVWPDPVAQLDHAYRTFGIGTNNIEVLLNGSWYCSGSTVPWYYPFWYLGITTPVMILVFFLIGLIRLIRPIRQIGILLLLWLVIPLTRYLIPTVGVIDGIRHFEEVLFPIAALAAIGFDRLLSFARPGLAKLTVHIALVLFSVLYLLITIVSYHPYQIAYFNELVGGVRGAFGNYDLDYWGTSQKEAVVWVNQNAPENAKVHIVMAAAVAGQYLRPDLLSHLNKYGYDESDFVIFLNRQSFFYRFYYAYEYLLHHKPAYTVEVRGAPLTWVFDNRTDNTTERQTPWWKNEDPCIIKYWRGETP